MSEDKETANKKKFIHANVSARVLYALTPLLKQTQEFAHSDYAFFNQMQTQYFGCYLLPADEGVLVAVVQGALLLAIRDEKGIASEPLKVTFPDEMLDALKPKVVMMWNENGMPFEVEMEPKAERILCSEGFGIVFPNKKETEKLEGSLGTWFNGDHSNVIDTGSYRAEFADVEFIARVVARPIAKTEPVNTVALNPELLTLMTEAAHRMNTAIDVTVGGKDDPIVIRSWDDSMYGLLMVLKEKDQREERGPSPLIDILTGKNKAASATTA